MQTDIYLSGLTCCRLKGLIPCFTVLFYSYSRKHTGIIPVDGISPLAMMYSTLKLALLGKNDFELFSFPIAFFRYGKAVTNNTQCGGGRG